MTNLVIDGTRSEMTRHFGPLFDSGHLPPRLAAVRARVLADAGAAPAPASAVPVPSAAAVQEPVEPGIARTHYDRRGES